MGLVILYLDWDSHWKPKRLGALLYMAFISFILLLRCSQAEDYQSWVDKHAPICPDLYMF
jgi:hypothetical protein